MKGKILIFCEFYLPGFRSGGGMWTVVNLVDRFSYKYDFFIVTRNHDNATNKQPYDSIKTGEWNQVGNAKVYYFAYGELSVAEAATLVISVEPDAILLNSAFGMPSLRLLSARRKKLIPRIPVIIAPCGELGSGALSLKPIKKRIFLRYAQLANLYQDVLWKASSESEEKEIKNVMGSGVDVVVAPDLVPKTILPNYSQNLKPKKRRGHARFVIITRVVPKKNIHYFLDCLREVSEGGVTVEIVGPVEDNSYWKRCENMIADLPGNIAINLIGPLEQSEAIGRAFKSHFFALPSLNENFGYVFIESLAAGCPLLISDQTIWSDIQRRGVGWTIPLRRRDEYVQRINECVMMDDSAYRKMSAAARAYAVEWLAHPASDRATELALEKTFQMSPVTTANG